MTDSLALTNVASEFRPLLLEGDAQVIGSTVLGWVAAGLTARVVRGRKARTLTGLFDEFSAALQFPLYFGENKDAFNECITDLEALPAGDGYVLAITEPDQVLADAEADELQWLAGALESASAAWSQPVELGEWWDRPAVPFHVVLAGERAVIDSARRRWMSAGARPLSFSIA